MTDGTPIYVIGAGGAAWAAALEAAGFTVREAADARSLLSALYSSPPRCIVLPAACPGSRAGQPLVLELKNDNAYGHAPVLVTLPAERIPEMDWQRFPADDYLAEPFSDEELVARVRLCIARTGRDVNANPLTGLPGNYSIMREAERRLDSGDTFALAYVDLDNFKPFNDKYGFARGDEVLRMTARILVNVIGGLGSRETYVGHVGGDDFLFITPSHLVEHACADVCRNFDLVLPNFYDDEDRTRGEIRSVDRAGNPQTFPLMGCSIAVIDTARSAVQHLSEMSARAAVVKKYAKSLPGSDYLVDRRR